MPEVVDVGVRFAREDFGTTYSALSYSNKYRLSRIMVYRSFVSGPSAGRGGGEGLAGSVLPLLANAFPLRHLMLLRTMRK